MKRVLSVLIALSVFVSCSFCAMADNGKVTYSGNAGEFIFAPGSEYSPTDLFPNFKDVMPGDSISQPINIRNDASKDVKVKVYMRALGAHEGSEAFLSELRLRVQKDEDGEMAYMFDAPADQTATLTDWVYLGTLYSGGEIDLNVILDVPVTLDNTYKNLVGYLDWQFMIEELPTEPDDPDPPFTGDSSGLWMWVSVLGVSLLLLVFVVIKRKKDEEEEHRQTETASASVEKNG